MTDMTMDLMLQSKLQYNSLRMAGYFNGNPVVFSEEDVVYEQHLTNYLGWYMRSLAQIQEKYYNDNFGRPEDDEPPSSPEPPKNRPPNPKR